MATIRSVLGLRSPWRTPSSRAISHPTHPHGPWEGEGELEAPRAGWAVILDYPPTTISLLDSLTLLEHNRAQLAQWVQPSKRVSKLCRSEHQELTLIVIHTHFDKARALAQDSEATPCAMVGIPDCDRE